MLDYSYDVVKVTTLNFGTEYMVTRTDQFEKATHVSPQGFFKTEQEMTSLFSDYPTSIQNIYEIVKMCNTKLPAFKYHLPKFSNPSDKDDITYFNDLCMLKLFLFG